MIDQRTSGILLHPSSLPGPGGHGDIGPSARRFIDWLQAAGQHLWQMLPLNPPGGGNSPYTALSVLAANPLLVSPEDLLALELLKPDDLTSHALSIRYSGTAGIDFEAARSARMPLLRRAAAAFDASAPSSSLHAEFADWCDRQAAWAADYALFMALATNEFDQHWGAWPQPLRLRDSHALEQARQRHATEIRFWLFVQWQFDRQWSRLRRYANERGVALVGDMPIYCALDSVDVWQCPELFQLDDALRPRRVAGVPPDYFSATGQLWGNPLYDWPVHTRHSFAWWRARLARTLEHADIVRIDHFRALAAYWSVPAGADTAIDGVWEPGPGLMFLQALASDCSHPLPVIAEDLGLITPDVIALRDAAGLPGMSVLQFAFGDTADNMYLPHQLRRDCVVYTGTHDNDTTVGWFSSIDQATRVRVCNYLGVDGRDVHWSLIHAASQSVARLAIYPLQDVLGLDGTARMNRPGVAGSQWGWQFDWDWLHEGQTRRLRELAIAHGRHPPRSEPIE